MQAGMIAGRGGADAVFRARATTRPTPGTVAAEVGGSRAALARRFAALVGEPPMTLLTGWRLALAADLLREPDATLGAVARQVGYGSAFALSTAFKRVRGISPHQHRAGTSASGPPSRLQPPATQRQAARSCRSSRGKAV